MYVDFKLYTNLIIKHANILVIYKKATTILEFLISRRFIEIID